MKWRKSESEILVPGDTFEKYTVEKLLGQGGMGAVYLVRHNVLDSFFAMKVLSQDVASRNKQFVDRFIREAKLACRIKHSNLISVHDAGQNKENGMYYLIMDYVSGGSIRDLLKSQGSFSIQKALSVTEQIAEALNEAYKYNMVHRDIKPDNIMFTASGTAKLADLGIAKSANEQDTMLTIEATVFGTPAYMSPEQAMDSSKVDCRADIYSLGIVLFEMLAGQHPYRGTKPVEILSQVVRDENIPDIREYSSHIPVAIAELIRDMTAKQLEKRIATPAELLRRLRQITSSDIINFTPENIKQVSDSTQVTMPTLAMDTHVEKQDNVCQQLTMPTMVTENVSSADSESEMKKDYISDVTLSTMSTEDNETMNKLGLTATIAKSNALPSFSSPPNVQPQRTVTQFSVQQVTQSNIHNAQSIPNNVSENILKAKTIPKKKKFVLSVVALILLVFIVAIMIFKFFPKQSVLTSGNAIEKETEEYQPEKEQPLKTKQIEFKKQPTDEKETKTEEVAISSNQESYESSAMLDDKLEPNAIIILGRPDDATKALRASLIDSCKYPVVFNELETFSHYREQLKKIISSKPKCVILLPAGRYADLNMSLANFESLIRAEAEMLRDNIIPFAFILSKEDSENRKVIQFNAAIKELCNLRSFPIAGYEQNAKDTVALILQLGN